MTGRWAPFLASATLFVLVMGVFALLRDYGPEAAVRRFHRAAVLSDWNELERIAVHAKGSASARELAVLVRNYTTSGAQLAPRRVDRSRSGQVVAEIAYVMPGRVNTIFWVVRKEPEGWLIATDDTLSFRPMPGFGFDWNP